MCVVLITTVLGLLVTILQFSKVDPQIECNISEIRFLYFFEYYILK